MYPAKIAVVLAGLVLTSTVVVHQKVVGSIRQVRESESRRQVERAAGLFLIQNRLQALEFMNQTAQYARTDAVVKVFASPTEQARRQAAFEAVNNLNEDQIPKASDRRAALVALVDDQGRVISRDLNLNAMYGEDLKSRYSSVGMALSGIANKDTWAFNKRMYSVATAPVRAGDGRVLGALVVGFEESAKDTRSLRDAFGAEVAVFLNKQIYASSFAGSGQSSAEEQELAKSLFSGPEFALPAIKARRQTPPFDAQLGGSRYSAVVAPLLGNASQPEAGFVVLASLDEAAALANRAGLWIWVLGTLSTLLSASAAFYIGRTMIGELEKIEVGVTEIINGNRDYVFEKGSAVSEGLENALNVMVARLTGRPEPSDSGDPMLQDLGREQSGPQVVSGGMAGAPAPSRQLSPENQDLAREPEEQYLRRLFNEYVHAREQSGEGTKDLSYGSFIDKLKANETELCKKYDCRAVRFKVIMKGGQATLKPVPLP